MYRIWHYIFSHSFLHETVIFLLLTSIPFMWNFFRAKENKLKLCFKQLSKKYMCSSFPLLTGHSFYFFWKPSKENKRTIKYRVFTYTSCHLPLINLCWQKLTYICSLIFFILILISIPLTCPKPETHSYY